MTGRMVVPLVVQKLTETGAGHMASWNPKAEPYRVCGTYKMAAPVYWANHITTHATLDQAEQQATKLAANGRMHTVDIDQAMGTHDWCNFGHWVQVRRVKGQPGKVRNSARAGRGANQA